MKGDITTNQIFWIIVFLISLVIFIGAALWLKGYGTDVIHTLPSFLPGVFFYKRERQKGLSITLNMVLAILAVLFILLLLAVGNAMGLGAI